MKRVSRTESPEHVKKVRKRDVNQPELEGNGDSNPPKEPDEDKIERDNIEFHNQIGKGAFSTVHRLDEKNKWANEAGLALQYLHKNNCLHRDIKPQNCLLFENNTLKLCDFGLSREVDNNLTVLSSYKGTVRYIAPEIINTNEDNKSAFSIYSDIYAYGMLLLAIYTRKSPFEGMDVNYVTYHVGKGELEPEIPEQVPAEKGVIMRSCWKVEPNKRPTIEQILSQLKDSDSPDQNMQPLTAPQGGMGQQGSLPRSGSLPPQALQQLLQVLKSPHSPQQEKQVLAILKANPPLMAAFIKQRTQQAQLLQQQQAAQQAGQPVQQVQQVQQNPQQTFLAQQQQQQQQQQHAQQTQWLRTQQLQQLQRQRHQQQVQQQPFQQQPQMGAVQGPFNPTMLQQRNPMHMLPNQLLPQMRQQQVNQGDASMQQYQLMKGQHQQQMLANQNQAKVQQQTLMTNRSPQQVMQQVRSPQTLTNVRSPNPIPSPQPLSQPAPSPRTHSSQPSPRSMQMQSPHPTDHLLSQNPMSHGNLTLQGSNAANPTLNQDDAGMSQLDPQDQLSRLVDTL